MMVKDIRDLVIDRFLTKVFDKGLMLTLLLEEEEQQRDLVGWAGELLVYT